MLQAIPFFRRKPRRYLAVNPPQVQLDTTPMLETWVWRINVTLTTLGLMIPGFGYLAYACALLAILLSLADRRVVFRGLSLPFVLLLVAGLLMWPLATKAGWKDQFFIFAGLSLSLAMSRMRVPVELLTVVFLLGNVFVAWRTGGLSAGLQFDLLDSASSFEGNFGFLFGLFFVYFIAHRRWGWALFAFAASVLALKRVVLLAEIVAAAVLLLPPRWQRRLTSPPVMIAANIGVLVVLLLYASHALDKPIGDLTGLPPNHFGKGRQELYAVVSNALEANPWRFLAWGAGPGAGYDAISLHGVFGTGSKNLHSDVMKLFYEYGFLTFGLFFWLGYRHPDVRLRALFLYSNVLFVSDNVLIYQYFLFFLVALARMMEDEAQPVTLPAHAKDTAAGSRPGESPGGQGAHAV